MRPWPNPGPEAPPQTEPPVAAPAGTSAANYLRGLRSAGVFGAPSSPPGAALGACVFARCGRCDSTGTRLSRRAPSDRFASRPLR